MFFGYRMKTVQLILALGLFAAAASEAVEPTLLTNEDSYLLVDRLLDLSDSNKNSLSQYKEWETRYIKIRANALKSPKHMALYQFVVFIADARALTHTLEEIGIEIADIYNKDKNLFLAALENNPAFVPAVCSQLGGYFNLIGKEKELDKFIVLNRPLIEKHLYAPNAKRCLAELQKRRT
jgi:hypothetical protein